MGVEEGDWNDRHHWILEGRRDRGLWGAAATAAGLLACYGTVALLPILAAMGISISLNEGVWALSVAGAAGLAIVGTVYNAVRHRRPWALALAVPGGLAVIYTRRSRRWGSPA